MKKSILIFFLFLLNLAFCQYSGNEISKLKAYTSYKRTSLGLYKWSTNNKLRGGLTVEVENYANKELRSIYKEIYDSNNNLIYEIQTFGMNDGYKIDTIFKYSYKYDEQNRLIEKRYSCGIVEKYSDFDANSNPKLIERFSENNETLYFWPITEKREFDPLGNLVKEIKTEIDYPDSNDTVKKYKIETNLYKYNKFNNVIEIRRNFDPKAEFPIIMTGGLPLYETENYKYKYNKNGLWIKKYWIVEGKKRLIQKRIFRK